GDGVGGVWGRARGCDVVRGVVGVAEIDVRYSRRYAEGARLNDRAGVLGGGDQRFRGHAAGVETFAPHLALLDQHHRYAEGGRGGGDREAAGARADHADVGLQTFRHGFSRGRTRKDEDSRSRSVTDHALSVRSRACAVVRARSRFTTTGMSARTPSATKAPRSSGVSAAFMWNSSRQSGPPAARQDW